MYFITTKHADYVLFCMTPSERAAVGLTEKNVVRLLGRSEVGGPWTVLREWPGTTLSHTDFMTALGRVAEPPEATELIAHLPPHLRG